MDDFLLKPYDTIQVRDRIAAVQARRAGQTVSASENRPATEGGLNLQAFQLYGRRFPAQADQAQELYRKALDEEWAALLRAFTAEDREQIGARAHRLHALGGLVGATELVNSARHLTAHARQGADYEALRTAQAAVAAALTKTKSQLVENTGASQSVE
jgi:hypothetical protein